MDIVTKDFAVVDAGESDEHPNGAFHVILSAPTHDRDGEIVDSKAFEPLPDHITFDTDHSMTCDSVVGSGVPAYADDGTLQVKGSYCADERSQIIRQKVKDRHIRTTSVTFMAAERAPDAKGIPHVIKAELINGTFTPVPANRDAVVLTAKSIVAHEVAAKAGARNSSSDAAALQEAHDIIAGLGASCSMTGADSGEKAAQDADEKSVDPEATPTAPEPAEAESVQDAGADSEPDDDSKSADDAAETAALEAAVPAAKSADDEAMTAALLRINENAARLAFGG